MTSPSTRRLTGWAAPGGRTPIPACPATSPRTCTRTRSPLPPNGATASPRARDPGLFRAGGRPVRGAPLASASAMPWLGANSAMAGGTSPPSPAIRTKPTWSSPPPACSIIRGTPTSRASTVSAGAMFHSARWDHSVDLDGVRLGIIGTGSTGVQIVCAVVDRVSHLSLFQRTAQWIMPSENPAVDDEQRSSFVARSRRPPPVPSAALRLVRHLRQRRGRCQFERARDGSSALVSRTSRTTSATRSSARSCGRPTGPPASAW